LSSKQRVALLAVAALIAVVAFVALRPSKKDTDQTGAGTTSPSSQPTQSTPGAQAPQRKPLPPLLKAGEERTLSFTKGETVRFRVRHSTSEEVHVHGYDISRELPAGRTTTVKFKADIEGIFEIELERSGTPLGKLEVEP